MSSSPWTTPKKPEGGLAILHGNLAPKGAVVKQAGVKPSMHYFEGQAGLHLHGGGQLGGVNDKIQKGDVLVIRYEGPKGWSWDAGDAHDMLPYRRPWDGRGLCPGHRRALLRLHPGALYRPRVPGGCRRRPIAAVEEGDRIIIDIPNRTLTLCVPEEEIQRRLERVRHIHKPATPALERYAALVTSADQGAVLQLPREQ